MKDWCWQQMLLRRLQPAGPPKGEKDTDEHVAALSALRGKIMTEDIVLVTCEWEHNGAVDFNRA